MNHEAFRFTVTVDSYPLACFTDFGDANRYALSDAPLAGHCEDATAVLRGLQGRADVEVLDARTGQRLASYAHRPGHKPAGRN